MLIYIAIAFFVGFAIGFAFRHYTTKDTPADPVDYSDPAEWYKNITP